LLEKHGDRFKNKTFTIKEIDYCNGKQSPSMHFAGRFAAKEAVKKCIYSSGYEQQLGFNKIEILNDVNGVPIVSMIKEISYKEIKVSISHESEYAIGMAILFL